MKNEHDESKLLWGVLIGGIMGAGALYCIYAAQHRKTPVLKRIGRTISDVGELLENCNLDSGSEMLENIGKSLPKGYNVMNNLADWVDAGASLWKKLKKG